MAIYAEQGEILELKGRVRYVLVLSKDLFNRTGMSIVCPVVEHAFEDALHIPVQSGRIQGIALCEQMISMDLSARFYRNCGKINYMQIQNVTDAVQAIFDYYPYE